MAIAFLKRQFAKAVQGAGMGTALAFMALTTGGATFTAYDYLSPELDTVGGEDRVTEMANFEAGIADLSILKKKMDFTAIVSETDPTVLKSITGDIDVSKVSGDASALKDQLFSKMADFSYNVHKSDEISEIDYQNLASAFNDLDIHDDWDMPTDSDEIANVDECRLSISSDNIVDKVIDAKEMKSCVSSEQQGQLETFTLLAGLLSFFASFGGVMFAESNSYNIQTSRRLKRWAEKPKKKVKTPKN